MKDVRGEVREFLTTRHAKVIPERAGLPRYGGPRRVTGLRQDKVASLAGISTGYYTRLGRGNIRGVSGEVLDGIARAPHLGCPPHRRDRRPDRRHRGLRRGTG